MRPSFCPFRRFKRLSAGSGSTKTVTSVTILPAALIYQKGRLGMHVPGVSGSQNLWMGEHVKMTTRSCDIDQRATKTNATMMTRRIVPCPMMRWY